MDVFEMRVPDYFGRARAERIPQNCAVNKSKYIEDRKGIIKEINTKIAELTKKLNTTKDKQSAFYQADMKRLKKFYEIKQNCEASIALAKKQIAVIR